MLSSAKIGRLSWRYYQASVAVGACEYYLGAGEKAGTWAGRGLAQLGLTDGAEVTEAHLESIFARALHPVTGQALGRAWRVDAVTGFDLTFSAPKSVSTLWAMGGATAGTQIDQAHRAAVLAALTYLDHHAAVSRRGTDGVEQVATSGLAAALFDHRTSRAGDPQLHTHALVPNKVMSADGVWRTIDGHEIYHHKKAAGVVYQAALRNELRSRLGVVFDIPNAQGQAEIVGVPAELMTAWSKRAAQIAAEADPTIAEYEEALGRDLTKSEKAVVTKTAVLKTRAAKEPASSVSVLHARWRAEAASLGWDAVQLHNAVTTITTPIVTPGSPVDPALFATAVLAAGRRHGVFSRADLTIEVAARLPNLAATAEQTRDAVEQITSRGLSDGRGSAVNLGSQRTDVTPRTSDTRYTSTEVLDAEARILRRAAVGRASDFGSVPATTIDEKILTGLAEDQRAAVEKMTSGGDLAVVLTAPAGAGKTTTLGAASQVWQAAGFRVVGLAPSARAAAELGKATGGDAETLAKWLHEQRRSPAFSNEDSARWTPTPRTVLILDEASMASTFDLDTLTEVAARTHAKVVLVGDPAQIGVINGPGGMLPALAGRGHGIELTGVHRFRNDWEAAATLRLRNGDRTVIDTYVRAGRLHAIDQPDQAASAVFAHWQSAESEGTNAMMLARTRVDVDQLNALAKSAAQSDGQSHGPEVVVGELRLQAGDVIRTRRNNRRLPLGESHVRNGDRYRVLATTEDGALLVDELTGRGSTVLPPRYVTEHVDHGWATTIDAAQGATTDIAILLVRPGMDREHLYVGLTRGRDENHAYIAPLAEENDRHRAPTEADIARRTLESALAHSSTDNAAHTLLDRSRGANASSPGPARVPWRPAAVHSTRPTADTTPRRTPTISGP